MSVKFKRRSASLSMSRRLVIGQVARVSALIAVRFGGSGCGSNGVTVIQASLFRFRLILTPRLRGMPASRIRSASRISAWRSAMKRSASRGNFLRTVIRNSYRGHYRRMVPEILQCLEFCSNNERHRPIIQALDLLKCYADSKLQTFPAEEVV